MENLNEKSLVLRTVYFDASMDEELRIAAANHKISKGTLIRKLLDIGLRHQDELQEEE